MKNTILTKFLTICLSFVFVSCSSHYRRPESIEAKIDRFQTQDRYVNLIPSIQMSQDNISAAIFKKASRLQGRSIASSFEEDENSNFSNKRLYFLVLLSQYNKFQKLSTISTSSINSCPKFHTSFLDYNENFSIQDNQKDRMITYDYQKNQLSQRNYLAKHPELFLPVSMDSALPQVVDLIKSSDDSKTRQVLQQAINLHASKTFLELQRLCEHGQSTNYYNFENLISHIQKQNHFPGNSYNAKLLLKTSLFSNYAIIYSLTGSKQNNNRTTASFVFKDQYKKELIKRVKAPWVDYFFKEMYFKR